MAHRHLTDSNGTDWVVFDVTPRADDRRVATRRQDGEEGQDDEQKGRRGEERRLITGGQRPPRLTQGWVCFESSGERRRLQPIPADWSQLTDPELQVFLDAARVVPDRKRADPSATKRQR